MSPKARKVLLVVADWYAASEERSLPTSQFFAVSKVQFFQVWIVLEYRDVT